MFQLQESQLLDFLAVAFEFFFSFFLSHLSLMLRISYLWSLIESII